MWSSLIRGQVVALEASTDMRTFLVILRDADISAANGHHRFHGHVPGKVT
jgi:hypothetical protein